jgi:hypothetical protein
MRTVNSGRNSLAITQRNKIIRLSSSANRLKLSCGVFKEGRDKCLEKLIPFASCQEAASCATCWPKFDDRAVPQQNLQTR